MQRKIFKTGHSAAVTLSQHLLKDLSLKVGDTVEIAVKADQIIVSKSKSKKQLDLGLKIRPKL
jgi:antitoxin component of MazEF toxin-antitoxin module